MARYCSDCSNLNTKKPKTQGGKGCYKCSKTGKFVLANMPACEKFEKSYSRNNYEKEKLYEEGKEIENRYNSNVSPGALLIILIILIIIAIFVNMK